MPKRLRNDGASIGAAPVFAEASHLDVPSPFTQSISEVPSGIASTVLQPSIKMTSASVSKLLKRNAIVATHWYNIPFVDGLRSVSAIYKIVEKYAFNYQRTHQDAFFEAYPELLILKSDESTTTSDLRRSYKRYCSRIAHYWYEYGEAKKLQIAALLNLMTMTRYNGNETFKHFASDMRWSRINSACVLYERFPSPCGAEASMTGHTRYATGKTTFGADIVSIGLWKVDILGNVFSKNIPLDTFVNSKPNGYGDYLSSTQVETSYGKNPNKLLTNMALILQQYANTHNQDTPFGKIVTSPRIENGTIRYVKGTNASVSVPMNDADDISTTVGKFGVTSALSKNLWDAYDMWTKHLVYFYADMMDPNNDKYTFATEQLKLFEPSSKLEDVIKVIRSNANYDITSLANLMTYKSKNSASSSTVVKVAPALYDSNNTSVNPLEDDNLIEMNLERFDVTSSNIPKMIQDAKVWPHLNPTVFSTTDENTELRPLVINATQAVSQEVIPSTAATQSQWNQSISITGKFATMFDLAVSSSAAPDVSRIEGSGIDSKALQQFVEDCNSIVYEEAPDSPWLMAQPLIDCTDLGQCGFNILISSDDPNPNEWERYFLDYDNYFKHGNVTKGYTGSFSIESTYPAASPSYGELLPQVDNMSNIYHRRHVANRAYLETVQHTLVFVGVGIFSHPWFVVGSYNSGFFAGVLSATEGTHTDQLLEWFNINSAKPVENAIANWNLWAAESSLSDDASNGTIAVIKYLGEQIQSGYAKVNIIDFIFSPLYGPVQIAGIIDSDQSSDHLIPQLSGNNVYEYTGSDAAFVPQTSPIELSEGSSIQGNSIDLKVSVKRTIAYDWFLTPLRSFLPFINKIVMPRVNVGSLGSFFVSDPTKAITLTFNDISKWRRSLLSQVVVQFVGLHDTHPFWTDIDLSVPAQDIAASNRFPENNILALPRVNQATKPNRDRSYTGGKHGSATEVGSTLKSFEEGSSLSEGGKSHSFKRKGSKRSKSKKDYRDKADFKVAVNSDGTDYRSKDATALAPRDGSLFDSSSKTEDNSFEKKKKGDATASLSIV